MLPLGAVRHQIDGLPKVRDDGLGGADPCGGDVGDLFPAQAGTKLFVLDLPRLEGALRIGKKGGVVPVVGGLPLLGRLDAEQVRAGIEGVCEFIFDPLQFLGDVLLAAVLSLHIGVLDVEALQEIHLSEEFLDPAVEPSNLLLVPAHAGARPSHTILEALALLWKGVGVPNALASQAPPSTTHPQIDGERCVVAVQVLPEAVADLRAESGGAIDNSVLGRLTRRAVGDAASLQRRFPLLDCLALTEEGIKKSDLFGEGFPFHGFDHGPELVEVLTHRLALVASAPTCGHVVLADLGLLQHSGEERVRRLGVRLHIEVLRGDCHDVGEHKARVRCGAEASFSRSLIASEHRVLDGGDINRRSHCARVPVEGVASTLQGKLRLRRHQGGDISDLFG